MAKPPRNTAPMVVFTLMNESKDDMVYCGGSRGRAGSVDEGDENRRKEHVGHSNLYELLPDPYGNGIQRKSGIKSSFLGLGTDPVYRGDSIKPPLLISDRQLGFRNGRMDVDRALPSGGESVGIR